MKKISASLFLLVSCIFLYSSEKVVVSQWLTTNPLKTVYPAFHETKNVKGNAFSNRDVLLFDYQQLENIRPYDNKHLDWIMGQSTQWNLMSVDSEGFATFDIKKPVESPKISFCAIYIEAERWMELTLKVRTAQMAQVSLNGNVLGNKTTIESEEGSLGKIEQNLELKKGKHLIMIKSLYTPDDETDWKLHAALKPRNNYSINDFSISPEPKNIKNINNILDGVKVRWVKPSACGNYYAVAYREAKPPKGEAEGWIEIKKYDDGSLIHSFKHASIHNLQWLPNSNAVSYVAKKHDKYNIYKLNLEKGNISTLLQNKKRINNYHWDRSENFIIYSISEDNNDDSEHIRHILGMRDRIPNWRNRSFLYYLDVNTKTTYQLTYGNLSTNLHDISPCGNKILFSQTRPDYQERPYFKHNMYVLYMNSLEVDTVRFDEKWSVRGQFSPDSEKIMFTGGPEAFGDIGRNIPEGLISNDRDTQIYLYDLSTKDILTITYDFNPSVSNAHWHTEDNNIYFTAQDKDKIKLFTYSFQNDSISEIPTPVDIVSNISYSAGSKIATYSGEGMSDPSKGYWLNLENHSSSLIEDTESKNYKHVQFGKNMDWDYRTNDGVDISGRVYLPPDFDETKKYPLIVYYYGGIAPVSRRFGGRYPFNLWAGQGYVVYVLQPSGAIGFGQEFSAAHVNNWGITVTGEIIESTEAFLDEHTFIDDSRIGCIGASYGGFMTMLLLTETDMFATAVSHAGISSISSYWGQGYWGYAYSASATAYNYPWNSPEIYIDQSPLFSADKINTPLLLLTGDQDTNVPPGESLQMYTALKILGKPVELLKVKGQDHHILNYEKRIEWNNAILAWFDKWLKEQNEWWEKQFPKKNF